MSSDRRDALVEALIEKLPKLGKVVTDVSTCLTSGNWDLVAYSYQQSFEALWDHAAAQTSGLAILPLMMLWRQSVELSIKAAYCETSGGDPSPSHNLTELFDGLLKARGELDGLESDKDDYTAYVRRAIVEFQKVDERADRYRYPTNRAGEPFTGIDVDLDRLFQAHWIITGWCDAASNEAEQRNSFLDYN